MNYTNYISEYGKVFFTQNLHEKLSQKMINYTVNKLVFCPKKPSSIKSVINIFKEKEVKILISAKIL